MRWRTRLLAVALPLPLAAVFVQVLGSDTEPVSTHTQDTTTTVQPDLPAPAEAPVAPAVPDAAKVVTVSANPGNPNADTAVTADGIPAIALAAYQRAASIMATADPSCSLDWELLAAIGRVESDHGRYGGSQLGSDGVATPAILGPRLDGTHRTKAITDTDAGLLDGDKRWDRAVGPMQFIPSTWSVVAVDADADGKRNPQDIDDAALAAGVLLCSGPEDLAQEAGRRAAVYGYNHDESYVDLVLRLAAGYAQQQGQTALTAAFALPVDTTAPTATTPSAAGEQLPQEEMLLRPRPIEVIYRDVPAPAATVTDPDLATRPSEPPTTDPAPDPTLTATAPAPSTPTPAKPDPPAQEPSAEPSTPEPSAPEPSAPASAESSPSAPGSSTPPAAEEDEQKEQSAPPTAPMCTPGDDKAGAEDDDTQDDDTQAEDTQAEDTQADDTQADDTQAERNEAERNEAEDTQAEDTEAKSSESDDPEMTCPR